MDRLKLSNRILMKHGLGYYQETLDLINSSSTKQLTPMSYYSILPKQECEFIFSDGLEHVDLEDGWKATETALGSVIYKEETFYFVTTCR